jgi:hypothetical protein
MQPELGSGLATQRHGVAAERRGVGDSSSAALGCRRQTARRRREIEAADGSTVRGVGDGSAAALGRLGGGVRSGTRTDRRRCEVMDAGRLGGSARSGAPNASAAARGRSSLRRSRSRTLADA